MSRADFEAELTQLREQITTTKAELDRVQAAPVPVDEAMSRLRAHLDNVALGENPHGPKVDMVARILAGATPDPATVAALFPPTGGQALRELLLALFRTEIEAHVERALKTQATGTEIDTATRAETLARLTAALHEQEVAEEKCVLRAARAGVMLERRPDLNVEVLLSTFDDGEAAA